MPAVGSDWGCGCGLNAKYGQGATPDSLFPFMSTRIHRIEAKMRKTFFFIFCFLFFIGAFNGPAAEYHHQNRQEASGKF